MKARNRKALRLIKSKGIETVDQGEYDRNVIDHVIKTLYNNSDKVSLHLESEIYKPSNISLPFKESERLWAIMLSSGLVTPAIGFGNAGRVELTKTGYQLMAQYGGYKEYLASLANGQQPQTVILPIQIEGSDDTQQVEIAATSSRQSRIRKISKRK